MTAHFTLHRWWRTS
ncbi:trp operon leader peptide [Leclercia sp. AS011]